MKNRMNNLPQITHEARVISIPGPVGSPQNYTAWQIDIVGRASYVSILHDPCLLTRQERSQV